MDIAKEVRDLVDMFTEGGGQVDDASERKRHPYANLEKAAVLQEARIFHDSSAVRENPQQCATVIAQLLHLQDTGPRLSQTEATEIFFGVTKLFVSDDASLRRMVYLFLREVHRSVDPNDVIIVTSSLTKDMTCDIDLYRANALRVLSCIIDSAMLGAIERYVKQAIVDSSHRVASAALVSASRLFESSPDSAAIVRRWIGETQEAIKNENLMVQFHGVQLLYQIKSHDRLGVSKIVSQFSQRHSLKSPLALVLLVRYAAKLLRDEVTSGGRVATGNLRNVSSICKMGFEFLESSLKHRNDMVQYEAARAICTLPSVEPQDMNPAINVLKIFLSSAKPTARFAAVRTLAKVASSQPRLVSKCNDDLAVLIGDSNRSIATLAITTLLKTGSENYIDRLLKQVSSFLHEIEDDYKITVVRSLQQLCFTYPSKHRTLVGFLSSFLREEGGFEFKRSIVDSIVSVMRAIPETVENSLLHLCEFIEDCEYAMLSTEIMHLLGELGPTTSSPARYIRFLYNRIILDNAIIRAAAVSALARFAAQCPSLRSSITTLLKRCLNDEDDETRDRAAVAVAILEEAMEKNPHIPPAPDAEADDIPPDEPAPDDTAAYLLVHPLPMSFDKLERSLRAYIATPDAMEAPEALTFSVLPVVEDIPEETSKKIAVVDEDMVDGDVVTGAVEIVDPAAVIYAIPELASLGRVFRSGRPVELTESETEYVVQCIKHIFSEHVVLQFIVQNTIEDQRLDNVRVTVDSSEDENYEATGEIRAEGIAYGTTESCFTVLQRNTDAALSPAVFACELRFHVMQIDPASGDELGEAFEEEYALEDLEITTSDFMAKTSVPDFRRSWDSLGNDNEVLEKFSLQLKSLEEAVAAIIDFLGMQPCDGTGTVKPGGKPHMLHLSGVFVGGKSVLARAQIAMQGNSGVVLKIAVRSEDAEVSRIVANTVG